MTKLEVLEDLMRSLYINYSISMNTNKVRTLLSAISDYERSLGDDGNGTFSYEEMEKNKELSFELLKKAIYE